jgi:hypothetical protein
MDIVKLYDFAALFAATFTFASIMWLSFGMVCKALKWSPLSVNLTINNNIHKAEE